MTDEAVITLLLMDGTSNGVIKCTRDNWNGVAFKIPRTDVGELADREDLKQTGVYLLLGVDEEAGQSSVYVGQAGNRQNGHGVLGRIKEHLNQNNDKAWYWTHAIALLTANDSFGPTEVSYLEHHFYVLAQKAGRFQIKNSNTPSPGHVTEEKKIELDRFTEHAKLLVGSLGAKVFEPLDPEADEVHSPDQPVEPLLYLTYKSLAATGRRTPEGFVVLEGSGVSEETTPSCPNAALVNREKYATDIGPERKLLRDILFATPSAAAEFVMGASASGNESWKNSDGVRLGVLEAQQAAL